MGVLELAQTLRTTIEKATTEVVAFQETMATAYRDGDITFNQWVDVLSIYPKIRDAKTAINWIIRMEQEKIDRHTKRIAE
jgi:hypothetical protein